MRNKKLPFPIVEAAVLFFLDNIPKTRYNRTNRTMQKGAPPCKRFLLLQN